MYLFCTMSAWSHDISIENRQGSIFLSWNQLALGRLVHLKDEFHGFRKLFILIYVHIARRWFYEVYSG